jgi:5-formaminoimidazole-4-carboxamide-1-(beta)-D-ribofuranosyl 5'-monophosphate synthetase
MISQTDIETLLTGYDPKNLTIAVLGGHSALDVCHGAKKHGFKTLAVCQKGREKTYSQYYKSRDGKGCIDDVIVVDTFADIVNEDVQEQLRKANAIMIQNRYFWVYCDYKKIENDFLVPIFGNREMLRREERDQPGNQYELLQKAGIRMPRIIRAGGTHTSDEELKQKIENWFADHSTPLLVKAAEAERGYERDFFIITRFDDYIGERKKRVTAGGDKEMIDSAVIEEFVIGPNINFNYFYSPLTKELEVMGTDTRRQTNMDGFLRLTAAQQTDLIVNHKFQPTMVENGHIACTTKESIIEKMFELGEKFVAMSQKECAPGIIGPFALQGAYVSEKGREEMVVFDVSMRIPGSPGTRFTPYSGYLYGESISYGERIAMEIQEAVKEDRLAELAT